MAHNGDRDRIVLALQLESPIYKEMLDGRTLSEKNAIQPPPKDAAPAQQQQPPKGVAPKGRRGARRSIDL